MAIGAALAAVSTGRREASRRPPTRQSRAGPPLLLCIIGAALATLWAAGLPPGAEAEDFAWRGAAAGLLWGAAVALAWRRTDRATVWIVVGLGLAFRLAAWGWPPALSSDLYRYVWDGRVQLSGRSPYDAPPAAPELAGLRDAAIWPNINRPGAVTVYPPGGQAAFVGLAAAGGDSVAGVKTAALAADLAALALLAWALRRRRLPAGRLVIYAWSPLVVAEVCVSGHLDALVLPMMLGALALAERGRPAWAGGVIGAAALVKLYPALLLAALPRAGRRVAVAVAAAVVALGYLPFALRSGRAALGFLPEYVRSGEDFNEAVRGFLAPLVGRQAAMVLCAAALAAAALAVARSADEDVARSARRLALAFILLLPTAVHPWYALWLVPLLCVSPHPAGLWIVAALPLSYLKYGSPGEVMPAWIRPLEWLPACALVALGWAAARRRRAALAEAEAAT